MPKPKFVTRITSVGRKVTDRAKEINDSAAMDSAKTWTLGAAGTATAGALAKSSYNAERNQSLARQRAPGSHPHSSGPGPLPSQRPYKSVL